MEDRPGTFLFTVEAPSESLKEQADRFESRGDDAETSLRRLPELHEEQDHNAAAAPSERRSRVPRAFRYLLLVLVLAAPILWVVSRPGPQAPQSTRVSSSEGTPVGTAIVETGDMPVVLSGLGTVTSLAMITVKTQINGQLTEVGFTEGQMVNKGDLLAQIDPRPYQVALEQAQGQLTKDQAVLKNAEVDLGRYKTLVAQNSIARQILDTQTALVQQNRGILQTDQAQVDAQKLNLTYCRIVAPISGRVGLRQVDPGNFVQTSDPSGIVIVTQVQPISVIFTLPEDNLPGLLQHIENGESLAVTAFDRSGTVLLGRGKLATIDNQIDSTTGTVKLRAIFDNPNRTLFPNQFVNVHLLVDTQHDVKLIPRAAVHRGAPGTFVYVVNPDATVTAKSVTLGPGDDQRVAIADGLQAGQVVVKDGTDRLKDGTKVRPLQNNVARNAKETSSAGTRRGTAPSEPRAAGSVPTPERLMMPEDSSARREPVPEGTSAQPPRGDQLNASGRQYIPSH